MVTALQNYYYLEKQITILVLENKRKQSDQLDQLVKALES